MAAGVGEGFAEDLDFEDFEDFEDDFDLAANEMGLRERQSTPAIRRQINRGAFIIYKGAG